MYCAVSEVGFYLFAFLQLVDGADDLAVLRKQTVPALVEPLGVASDESLLEHLYAMLTNENLPLCGAMQPNQQVCYAVVLFVHPMNQPFGNSGRGLQRLMCHEVQHRYIARVTYTGKDR